MSGREDEKHIEYRPNSWAMGCEAVHLMLTKPPSMLLKWVINILILYAAWRWLIKPLILKSSRSIDERETEGEYIEYEEVEDSEEKDKH